MSSGTRKADNKVPFAGGRYLLSHRLGNGSFGDIFEGYDTVRNCRVAVKLEKKKVRYPQLEYESKVYRVLHQPPVGVNEVVPSATSLLHIGNGGVYSEDNGDESGRPQSSEGDLRTNASPSEVPPFLVIGIPQIFYYDSEGDYNIMVMELCGPSLEDLFNYCHRRFSLKTVLMIAEQILHRIQYIHEKGFVHRDIKPENFTFGYGQKAHLLYVIDFGLSKLYWDCRKNTHIPFVDGKPLTGTARYCSANTHRGYEQSRRDDLESIGFLFVYFLKGSLPWQGIQAKDQQLKTIRIGEKKISTSLEDLCKGLPSELLKYCQYCRDLSYQQKPDYDYLRGLFRTVGQRYGYLCKPPSSNTDSSDPANRNPSTTCHASSETVAAFNLLSGKECSSLPNSSHGMTMSTVTAMSRKNLIAGSADEPDTVHGYYDWQFDWILKREREVGNGLQQQREMAQATAAVGNTSTTADSTAPQPSANPVHPSRSRAPKSQQLRKQHRSLKSSSSSDSNEHGNANNSSSSSSSSNEVGSSNLGSSVVATAATRETSAYRRGGRGGVMVSPNVVFTTPNPYDRNGFLLGGGGGGDDDSGKAGQQNTLSGGTRQRYRGDDTNPLLVSTGSGAREAMKAAKGI